ncbi:hypothetical protein HPO96_22810 [Kribbella sandramycini]|uniref:Uncharacterized protein n=1 Tax=Kribbella sandramycini TaxID=60450 RepID=A0A7Y4P0E9_9ACTN|nr:hypothetical protein [Kribbella sandramycini]MBB6566253.1 hypothetical protein [Kribbella sandramycini]NOL43082.1 hypothetical protein [Kribbella sandramycini]
MMLFPIGHYTGLRTDEAGRQFRTVRRGWRLHQLAEDTFGAWVLSHGTPDNGKQPWTAEHVLAAGAEAGLTDVSDHLEELASLGLLATVSAQDAEFLQANRIDVQFVGLGNSPDQPDLHAVGLPGLGATALLDPTCYELWQWGSLAPTIWHSCEVRASVVSRLDQPVDPGAVAAEVLGDLRFLLAHGCAYVDVADAR